MNKIEDLVKEIAPAKEERPKTYTAEVSHTDEEGIVWVRLPGAEQDTPTASTSTEVKMGDTVTVEWRNNRLYIAGNYTDPSAGVERVVTVDRNAKAGIEEAQKTADDALAKANKQMQYFWTDDDGAHVTVIPKDQYLDTPTGSSTLVDSNGFYVLRVADGRIYKAAEFLANRVTLNTTSGDVSLIPSGLLISTAMELNEKVGLTFYYADADGGGGNSLDVVYGYPNPRTEGKMVLNSKGASCIEHHDDSMMQLTGMIKHFGARVRQNGSNMEDSVFEVYDEYITDGDGHRAERIHFKVDFNGNTTVGGHSSQIGDIRIRGMENDTVVHTATGTALCALTLPAGTWSLVGFVRFPSNNAGVRRANIVTTRAANDIFVQTSPTQGGVTQLQVCNVVTPADTTTYYLNVYHTAGTDLTLPAGTSEGYINGIRAVRIA